MFPRSAGLLLHVTSLPGGRLGPEADRFVDFCAAAGQRWWQVLPVAPPGPLGSPYSALSAFAGSEALLDPAAALSDAGFAAFAERNRHWLPDYALFRALKDRHRGAPWTRWPKGLRVREKKALTWARRELKEAIAHHEVQQYAFHREWTRLRARANKAGVGLIGDVPLFVAHDSADVWAHPDLFKLTKTGKPAVVTGVPPDYFSETGQLWGDPHYHWAVHRRRRYRWWIGRLERMFELFDAVRLDHFLGLHRGFEIPARAKTAKRGRWAKGPGAHFLEAVHAALGPRPLIAENLGLVTRGAEMLRDRFGLPGMRVLQFCFGANPEDRPHFFPRNCAVYTGTHDNDTSLGWARKAGPDGKRALAYAGVKPRQAAWGLVRVAHLSVADLAIVPVQDVLGLGSKARMNRPGQATGNWRWQLRRGQLTKAHARKLRELTELAGR